MLEEMVLLKLEVGPGQGLSQHEPGFVSQIFYYKRYLFNHCEHIHDACQLYMYCG